MAPVVLELRRRPEIETMVCVTGQHRGMLDDALEVFGIRPDFDLDIMRPGQTLASITSAVLDHLTPVIKSFTPSRVLVHGDTTTSYAAATASFYLGAPVGHVEAGLRTGNIMSPWPEEFNRRCVDMIADLLWAPTAAAAANLQAEGAPLDNVSVTGNTVIDAIRLVTQRFEREPDLKAAHLARAPPISPDKRLLLVTGHRRESFGRGLAEICEALIQLANRPDVEIVWPVHPNPQVLQAVEGALKGRPNVHLTAPMDYLSFTALMTQAHIIITDSGGIQEEAPYLSKPVLVTRDETERPEAVAAGTAKLVGTSAGKIILEASRLLDDPVAYGQMASTTNPFGDGHAAARIVDSLLSRAGGQT